MPDHIRVLVFPSLVRNQVLEQHGQLRGLLESLIADAAAAGPLGEGLDMDRLSTEADAFCRRFRAHLAFEEEELATVFAALDDWGPERIRDMQDEHVRQRRELAALMERFEARGDVQQLAVTLRDLAGDLLRDMQEEEQGCLRASLLSADSLPFDRR